DPKKNYPVHLPAMPQLRKIAYIETELVLHDDDHSKEFPDSIGEIVYWRYDGNIWQTPYRSLLPKAVDNLLAAGRCMGAENVAMEVFRVIPAAAMTGEAAGAAAALSINENCQPRELDYNLLNKNLHTRA
ncbi:MAG: FAD-dependent oxidoreductase, partial [Lentisphaeria bacterium]|nr:FAD-dependent oxidoreductase [Lentisphaeria bacterium]